MDTDKGARDPLTERILKGCFEVIGTLGHGFAEAIYQRALALELREPVFKSIGKFASR